MDCNVFANPEALKIIGQIIGGIGGMLLIVFIVLVALKHTP